MPQLLSIQIGLAKERGADRLSKKSWESAIFKTPVRGPVWLDRLNLSGDRQCDLKNHGGPNRAALAYSAAHYPSWRADLGLPDLPYGAFGENLTLSELTEETVCIGDIYAVGSDVLLQVAQPRYPCWKLARRWQIKDLNVRVLERRWGGWYHRVLQEGFVEAGQPVTLVDRPYARFPVAAVFGLIAEQEVNPALTAELANCLALSDEWRETFAERAL